VLAFFIIVIIIIWCHSFTKLTGVGGKSVAGLLLQILLCSVYFYLLFYSSYIICRQLWTIQQMNSSATSSIAPEEARTTVILGCKLGYVELVVSLDMNVMLCIDMTWWTILCMNMMWWTMLCMDGMKYCVWMWWSILDVFLGFKSAGYSYFCNFF
jgi:hypothetical protein